MRFDRHSREWPVIGPDEALNVAQDGVFERRVTKVISSHMSLVEASAPNRYAFVANC
jgi:hypothetical protein